jgi:hypothetical protein
LLWKNRNRKGERRKKRTIGRNDHNLNATRNQLSKRLGKRQIPADEQADFADRRIEDLMRLRSRRGQVCALGVPDILLAVAAEDGAIVGDKVRGVIKDIGVLFSCGVLFRVRMLLDECPRDDADLQLLCKGLVRS